MSHLRKLLLFVLGILIRALIVDCFVGIRHQSINRIGYSGISKNRFTASGFYSTASDDNCPGNVEVICIGEALYDCIADDSAVGMSLGQMLEKGLWTKFAGGATLNVATASTKLGLTPAFIGTVGNDDDGKNLLNMLHEMDVDVDLSSLASGDAPTRLVFVTRDEEGDRTFAGFYNAQSTLTFSDCYFGDATNNFSRLFVDGDGGGEIVGNEGGKGVDFLSTQVLSRYPTAKWLVLGTLHLAASDSIPRFLDQLQALNERNERDLGIFIDLNWRPVFWPGCETDAPADSASPSPSALWTEAEARKKMVEFTYQYADVVKLTDEEAEWLMDAFAQNGNDEEENDDGEREEEEEGGEAFNDNWAPFIHQEFFPRATAVFVTAGPNPITYSIGAPPPPSTEILQELLDASVLNQYQHQYRHQKQQQGRTGVEKGDSGPKEGLMAKQGPEQGQGRQHVTGSIGCPGEYEGIRAVDTTGAGDAFSAGILASIGEDLYQWVVQRKKERKERKERGGSGSGSRSSGNSGGTEMGLGLELQGSRIEGQIRFAAMAGALTTTRAGAVDAQPTLQEVKVKLGL